MAEEQPAHHFAGARYDRNGEVAADRQMAVRLAVIWRVLTVTRVLRDVVRTDDALAAKRWIEHLRVARHREASKRLTWRAGQRVQRVGFSGVVQHVVEERAE